jgi:2-hydroxychromene-2-carboxylate isomerase
LESHATPTHPTHPAPAQPIFYYDLGNPWCYLAAERVMSTLPVVPEWQPVLSTEVVPHHSEVDRDHIERRAADLGLQPLRWPPRLQGDTRQAMLAATYAKRIGRAVAFSLAAFRQAFAAGRDLGDEQTMLIAGAATEIHPSALLKGIALRSVGDALARANARALAAGVGTLPAIQVGALVLQGEDVIEEAAHMLGAAR